ncbi:lengsin-like [Amphiura filiformis]|uniref:lengsin-like n=1 Tax=Amphiura filiformis TaxID=82378 RepID=UPI003B222D47
MDMMDQAKVLELLESREVNLVRFELSDMHGVPRCKTIPTSLFKKKASEGLNFGLGFMNKDPGYNIVHGSKEYLEKRNFGDCVCFPEYNTFTLLPWCGNTTGRVLLEPRLDGIPIAAYPRNIAKRQLDRLKNLGYSLLSAHEHEFYLVDKETRKPIYDIGNLRATSNNFQLGKFYNEIAKQLPKVGVEIETLETGCGAGQLQVTYRPAFGIRAPDNAHTYKISIKEIAYQQGYMATFMTKPFFDDESNGAHFCHSLWDVTETIPLTHDPDDPTGLSQVAQHWMAGILKHAPGLALLLTPTVNCFRRYDFTTPVNATWGVDNRSCYLRVKLRDDAKNAYMENRASSSASNPYLTLAATVAAGIDGIQHKLALPKGVSGSAYNNMNLPLGTSMIPHNMKDALKAFLDDEVICKSMGEDFVKLFTAAKMHEMELEEKANREAKVNGDGDSDWEHILYFESM